MVLRSEERQNQDGTLFYNQISWCQLENGDVEQKWTRHQNSDPLIKLVFLGIYKKK